MHAADGELLPRPVSAKWRRPNHHTDWGHNRRPRLASQSLARDEIEGSLGKARPSLGYPRGSTAVLLPRPSHGAARGCRRHGRFRVPTAALRAIKLLAAVTAGLVPLAIGCAPRKVPQQSRPRR